MLIKGISIRQKPNSDSRSKQHIVNIENQFLYEGYDNKLSITVPTVQTENVHLQVEDATVTKRGNLFFVNPKGGWTQRWINVIKVVNTDTSTLFQELFDVYPIPNPSICFADILQDTVRKATLHGTALGLGYFIGDRKVVNLKYSVLAFDVDIMTTSSIITIRCKNGYGNHELDDAYRQLQSGNRIRYYNVIALYPDQSVRTVSEKAIVIK